MVGDHVVQLAGDPRPFLDDRLARSDIALALRDPRTPVTIADHAANQQHDHRLHCCKTDRLVQGRFPQGRREDGRHDQSEADREAPRRRPDRQRVEGAEVRDRLNDEIWAVPDCELDRCDHRDDRPDQHRIDAAEGDRDREERRDQGDAEPVVADAAPEPDVDLGADREHERERPVERQRVGADATHASERRVHELKVNPSEPDVIGRSADLGAAKDQPTG